MHLFATKTGVGPQNPLKHVRVYSPLLKPPVETFFSKGLSKKGLNPSTQADELKASCSTQSRVGTPRASRFVPGGISLNQYPRDPNRPI